MEEEFAEEKNLAILSSADSLGESRVRERGRMSPDLTVLPRLALRARGRGALEH